MHREIDTGLAGVGQITAGERNDQPQQDRRNRELYEPPHRGEPPLIDVSSGSHHDQVDRRGEHRPDEGESEVVQAGGGDPAPSAGISQIGDRGRVEQPPAATE